MRLVGPSLALQRGLRYYGGFAVLAERIGLGDLEGGGDFDRERALQNGGRAETSIASHDDGSGFFIDDDAGGRDDFHGRDWMRASMAGTFCPALAISMRRLSATVAMGCPNSALMLEATRSALAKSASRNSRESEARLCRSGATSRSATAPLAMRPTVG